MNEYIQHIFNFKLDYTAKITEKCSQFMLNTNEKTSIKQYSKCLKIVKYVLLGFIDDLCNFMYLNCLFLAFLSLIVRVTLTKSRHF